MIKFTTSILQIGNNTGIEVPETIVEQLGGGKKPLVAVTLNSYTYRSAIAKMGDKFLVSLSAENRKNAKAKGGDEVEVSLQLDTEVRSVEVPAALQAALDQNKSAQAAFEKLAPSKKKAMVLSVTEAKSQDTRARRIESAIKSLI